ncbi:MAG: hypothetical protein Q7S37_04555 [bacterium]|nr:hypothetical protein [bacterium]
MEETTIQNRISLLEKLEQEVKIAKSALKAELDNDQQYVEVSLQTKETMARKKQAKEIVFASDSCRGLLDEIKANNEEIAILKEILATELMEVYQKKKTNEIEDAQGQSRKFILSVRILPKRVNLVKK